MTIIGACKGYDICTQIIPFTSLGNQWALGHMDVNITNRPRRVSAGSICTSQCGDVFLLPFSLRNCCYVYYLINYREVRVTACPRASKEQFIQSCLFKPMKTRSFYPVFELQSQRNLPSLQAQVGLLRNTTTIACTVFPRHITYGSLLCKPLHQIFFVIA